MLLNKNFKIKFQNLHPLIKSIKQIVNGFGFFNIVLNSYSNYYWLINFRLRLI